MIRRRLHISKSTKMKFTPFNSKFVMCILKLSAILSILKTAVKKIVLDFSVQEIWRCLETVFIYFSNNQFAAIQYQILELELLESIASEVLEIFEKARRKPIAQRFRIKLYRCLIMHDPLGISTLLNRKNINSCMIFQITCSLGYLFGTLLSLSSFT